MFVSHKFSQVEGQHWYKLFVCLFSSRNWPKKCNAGKFLTLKIVFSETRNILIDMSLYITYSHQRVYEQARKPRSYASLKLWLTYSLTGVKSRATSVAKKFRFMKFSVQNQKTFRGSALSSTNTFELRSIKNSLGYDMKKLWPDPFIRSLSMIFRHWMPPLFWPWYKVIFFLRPTFLKIYREALVVIFLEAPRIRLRFSSLPTPPSPPKQAKKRSKLHLHWAENLCENVQNRQRSWLKPSEYLISGLASPNLISPRSSDLMKLSSENASIPFQKYPHLSAWSYFCWNEPSFPRQFGRSRWRKRLCKRIRRREGWINQEGSATIPFPSSTTTDAICKKM